MSTLPSNKKKGKQKRVVTNRLIDTSRKILRSLLPQNLNVTQVIKQTGLRDKSYFYRSVKEVLIKSELIKQTAINRREDILELTEIGRDLAKLGKYIEDAQMRYQELVTSINKKLHLNEFHMIIGETALNNNDKASKIKKTLKSKLRDEGWNSDKLASYEIIVLDALSFERKTAYIFIVALCSNYVFFLAKLGNNEIARSILHRIITNSFDEHFSRSTEIFSNEFKREEQQLEVDVGNMLSSLKGPVYKYIKEFVEIDESKISLPPYDVDLKKSNEFLGVETIKMIRSIRYLYGLGSEEVNKEASELIEKYSSEDHSSDYIQSV